MDAVERFEHNGQNVAIHYDDSPESPRDWDNLGTMMCSHRRYTLGDEQGDAEDFAELEDVALSLPLYLYDHGGISMSVGDFGDPWDSGCVGVIYVTKETLRKEYSVKRITKATLDKARKVLVGEVETYDDFLRGSVYGYIVTSPDGESEDSCWGFYGLEYCIEEAKSAAESMAATQAEQLDTMWTEALKVG